MNPISRWYVKTALIYFIAALAVGLLLATQSFVEWPPLVGALTPEYFHLFMLGWVAQLIFGIVFWLFPTLSKERPRGSERLAWTTYALLNSGLLIRVVSEPLNALSPGSWWGWLLVLSALLQWLAGMGFILNTWGRVKGK